MPLSARDHADERSRCGIARSTSPSKVRVRSEEYPAADVRVVRRGRMRAALTPDLGGSVMEHQTFTAVISVHGVETTVSFVADSWSQAVEGLDRQYPDNSGWVLSIGAAIND